ncbi:beta strand repeat-containing protein [Scytonema sp. NUACC26]|uniref:beta strand repeat-containing protein n=1 Tax=Scytonema sp. NUACC26 TaxID=3140176 RepID=UPI0034DC924E
MNISSSGHLDNLSQVAFDAYVTPYFDSDSLQNSISGNNWFVSTSSTMFIDTVVNEYRTFIVNSTADVLDENDGVTTLREAIIQANAIAGLDAILFDELEFASEQTITLSLGQLSITDSLTIDGGNRVTVSGNDTSRVFEIGAGATVTLSGLDIANGRVVNDNGGGIYNSGSLTLDKSTVRNSTVTADLNATYGGGGIYNTGTIAVNNSTLSSNSVINELGGSVGGGIYNEGTVTVDNSTISNNLAGFQHGLGRPNLTLIGSGGGIYNRGTVMVNNSNLSSNSAIGDGDSIGGGIYNTGTVAISNSAVNSNSATTTLSSSYGGGIYNIYGTVIVSNSILSSNLIRVGGSGIGAFGGGIYNSNGGNVTVSDSTLSSNQAGGRLLGGGGGIYNNTDSILSVSNSTLSNNRAFTSRESGGGGIYNTGTASVSNSTIRDNLFGGGFSGTGGGILNDNNGTLTVNNSTISGNSVNGSLSSAGGGIGNTGTATISNSTISDNVAPGTFGNGGGISNSGTLTLVFSTLTLNQAVNGGGIVVVEPILAHLNFPLPNGCYLCIHELIFHPQQR